MTIHTDWLRVCKAESPESFVPTMPFHCKCVFVDGMPLLQVGKSTERWGDLVQRNFARPLQRYLDGGIPVAILAFDDYRHVPMSKAITQANRSKKHPAPTTNFKEGDPLEPVIPKDYGAKLRNRTYKFKVVEMIVEALPNVLRLSRGQTLIIDFNTCPIAFDLDDRGALRHTFLHDIPPCGECDIKFTRWARCYGNMVAHSIDGDFVIIALMDHERQLFVDDVSSPVKIAVRRYELNMRGAGEDASESKKRPRGASGGGAAAGRAPPSWEYVDIPQLYQAMVNAFMQCAPSSSESGAYQKQFMRMFACLITLTGTDFSRELPLLGPRKIWDILPDRKLWSGFLASYDLSTGRMVPGDMCNKFVRHLYQNKYQKHARGNTLAEVMRSLSNSKLSDLTKERLPSVARVDVTVRNGNWILAYWSCNPPIRAPPPENEEDAARGRSNSGWIYDHVYPNPIQEEFGFAASENRRCAVRWLDEAPDPGEADAGEADAGTEGAAGTEEAADKK